MTQQSPNKSEDVIYKKRLFYDNGIRFVEVKAKFISEYKPPAPTLKSHVNETFSYSAGLVNRGTSHYTAALTLLFYSKKEYADWLSFIGSEHKYYDEKGTIYLGVVTGKPDIQTAEMETKYIIQVQMSLIRKQGDEYRCKSQFMDLNGTIGHPAISRKWSSVVWLPSLRMKAKSALISDRTRAVPGQRESPF